jgi:2-oxoacid:acceptor oxidoreductase delta subunit (pyruvate/2-ketoisovalerate family)
MPELTAWNELPVGGELDPATAAQPRTGGWRTGVRPSVDLSSCVNCLLCWLYCPDDAVRLDGVDFAGFDLEFCKGCELCAAVCPTGAVEMVADE